MKHAFKEITKEAVLFGISATLLALAEPLLASVVGPMVGVTFAKASVEAVKTASPAIWLGAFFTAFGAIFAAVRTTANSLFGDKKPETSERPEGKSPRVALVLRQPEISLSQEVNCEKHQNEIKARRIEAAETIVRQ